MLYETVSAFGCLWHIFFLPPLAVIGKRRMIQSETSRKRKGEVREKVRELPKGVDTGTYLECCRHGEQKLQGDRGHPTLVVARSYIRIKPHPCKASIELM